MLQDVIRALIMSRFDKLIAEQDTAKQTNGHVTPPKAASADSSPPVDPTPPPLSKKHKQEVDEEEVMSDDRRSPAPKKKRKVDHDSDAVLAAKLQALEDRSSRATRGGGPKKTSVMKKKKTPKKKTADKVKAEDDSDIEGSGSDAKEKRVNRSGGFHVGSINVYSSWSLMHRRKNCSCRRRCLPCLTTKSRCAFSPIQMQQCSPSKQLSRPQTVKRIWAYVREHDLQDPKDKRMIRCDDGMRAVFKQDKVHMFTV